MHLRMGGLPAAIEAGAVTASIWLHLAGRRKESLPLDLQVLNDYAATLDQTSFGPHLLKLTHLAGRLLRQLSENPQQHLEQFDATTVRAWAVLERSSLLNVAEMRSEFLDVRDDMPATPAAVVTHMLQI